MERVRSKLIYVELPGTRLKNIEGDFENFK